MTVPMRDAETLTLRATVIAGKCYDDDFTVIWRSLPIGRIMLAPGLPPPDRAMRAYHTSAHLPVAVSHAFVLKHPSRGVGTSAHALCGLILTSRGCHCFRR
jgi:hypothetical protein